jgi:hypothetical protein
MWQLIFSFQGSVGFTLSAASLCRSAVVSRMNIILHIYYERVKSILQNFFDRTFSFFYSRIGKGLKYILRMGAREPVAMTTTIASDRI